MGHRCTIGDCAVGRGFFSGSGPGWIKEGKLPPPAMRNGQAKE